MKTALVTALVVLSFIGCDRASAQGDGSPKAGSSATCAANPNAPGCKPGTGPLTDSGTTSPVPQPKDIVPGTSSSGTSSGTTNPAPQGTKN